MHKYNVVFTFEKQGEVACCKGDGFEYAKVGGDYLCSNKLEKSQAFALLRLLLRS